jgi:hypothetical protein
MFSLPDSNPAGAIIIDTGTTLKRARMLQNIPTFPAIIPDML